jgi:hypothetical protein
MIQPNRSDRGMALVLVLTVCLALILVATPFVLSMILQERGGTMSRYASQAEWGAEGAKNYALWKLMYSIDPVERRSTAGPMATYTFDTLEELTVPLEHDSLGKQVSVLDPRGPIWGLSTQDEQGKLNVKTASPRSVARVQGMVDDRVGNLKDYLTLYSGRDATWVVPQRIRSMGTNQPGQATGSGIYVDSFHVLAPQSRVRLSKPGQQPILARVTANPMISGTPGLQTDPPIPTSFIDGVIEVEARHPVNLNTARREVLAALFEGLNLVNKPQSNVDGGTASRLANFFYNRGITRLEDFLLKLAQQGLNQDQFRAVALNAVCPTYVELAGSGTSPLCFRSYDVHTIEGDGVMSNPAGATVAGRGFREVVSVSPPEPQTLSCESQWDFDRMCLALAASIQRHDLMGYPYGNRLISWPNLLPSPYNSEPPSRPNGPSDIALKKQQGTNEAYVMPVPARDFRGESDRQSEQDLIRGGMAGPWKSGTPREHFDHDHEGKKLQGSAYSMDWRRVFTTMPAGGGLGPGAQPDVAGGGLEFWAKFDGAGGAAAQLIDIRERDWSNRITLRIEQGDLVFTVCDGTIGTPVNLIDDGAAEIRQPFNPQPDTGYHFGAYWKGTRYGHLALLVDGFGHPQQKMIHVNPEGKQLSTRLGSALSQTATSVVLKDDILPASGIHPIVVGNEVMLYDKGAGTVFRGMRNTTAVQHPADAPVQIFGYTSKVRQGNVRADYGAFQIQINYDKIPRTTATNLYNFGLDPQAVVIGDKMDTMPPFTRYIDPMQTDIGVLTPSIMDFPDQGYIRIENEIIFYTGRQTGGLPGAMGSNARFTGCVRGAAAQPGSVAARHDSNREVRLWSVAVSDTAGFDSPTIIQIDNEWFTVERDMVRPNFWISFLRSGAVANLRRGLGTFQSIPGAHSTGAPVLPTFLVRETHPQINTENLGRDDWVTVTDASNQKEQAQVNHVSPPHDPMGPQNAPWPEAAWNWGQQQQVAAFKAPVTRDYVADNLHVRVLKFPSGELLSLNWLTQTPEPQISIGPMNATIDEVKAYASPKQDLELAVEMPAQGGTSLNVRLAAGLGNWPNGGLLKIGDEYVGYGQYQNLVCSQLRRSWLGSNPEVHDAGDKIFALYWCPVASLASDIDEKARFIPLNGRLSGKPRRDRIGPGYTTGYVLIDDEVLLFEDNGGGTQLDVLARWDSTSGLYRGMFGTKAASHAATSALVYGLPWRYWDTYKPLEFDNTMSYFQWSAKMDLANWRSVAWTQELPAGDTNIVVHALVRVDAKGEWWDPPGVNDKKILYEFANGGRRNVVDRIGYQNDPGQFDVRFYWEYKQGSFDPAAPWNSPSWKRAPKLKELRVEYDRPTQTLHHEDR